MGIVPSRKAKIDSAPHGSVTFESSKSKSSKPDSYDKIGQTKAAAEKTITENGGTVS
ncbi:hypothetical protein NE236_21745 [Actinoallomurus purpureus]|uniref:hypothetical protein n=1 Tax=Actinoallomurus purpureus TaxID=478114 RepID=UPI0020939BB3|nr:hypothetical protein [Actinoallomurus purpureus]MCO6007604.1 hypothetical protein [Actinoallomurus purpureus]